MRISKNLRFSLAALLVTSGLVSVALAQVTAEPNNHYLNGGVSLDARQAMQAERSHYNLRLAFAQTGSGYYLAGVALTIQPTGNKVAAQHFEDCGPLFYVKLAPGRYRISAEYEGKKQELSTTVGAKGTDHVLYWR